MHRMRKFIKASTSSIVLLGIVMKKRKIIMRANHYLKDQVC